MTKLRKAPIGTVLVLLCVGLLSAVDLAGEKQGSPAKGDTVITASAPAAAADKAVAHANDQPVKMLKRVSLLARKQGQSREEFLNHWLEVHAPIAYQIPGIARYTCTVITASSTRKDGPLPIDLEIDGIAEMWFTDQQSLDAARNSPAFAALRADGAAFIGREIDFVTEETVIIPRSK